MRTLRDLRDGFRLLFSRQLWLDLEAFWLDPDRPTSLQARMDAWVAAVQPEPRRHVHVYSAFGNWCYLCSHRRRWWRFWEEWKDEEHDEPF